MSPPAPEAAENLLDEAEGALDEGDPAAAVEICTKALELAPGHPGAHFVRGDALHALGQLEAAADDYRAAALAKPDHASSWAALALTCFELLEFAEAQRTSDRAIREDPRNPEGWWVRSVVLEWVGDRAGSERARLHAQWLDPQGFPVSPSLSDAEIEDLVDEALSELHPSIRDYMLNVAVVIQDLPDEAMLRTYDPPASPLEMLGYFSGHSLMERSLEDPWSSIPPTIALFRRNLERQAADRDELIEQLRITLWHEIGHFLGLEEDDLERRGLD